ncbi:hypothetical protein [Streptomyces hokutonensis]
MTMANSNPPLHSSSTPASDERRPGHLLDKHHTRLDFTVTWNRQTP